MGRARRGREGGENPEDRAVVEFSQTGGHGGLEHLAMSHAERHG